MSEDALIEKVVVALLMLLCHVSTIGVCWFFYQRIKRQYHNTRISYGIADILAFTLAIAWVMGLVLNSEFPLADQIGFLIVLLPSQVAGTFCALLWMRARSSAQEAGGLSSFIGTFSGALLGLVAFPILGIPLVFVGFLLLLTLYVTFPFGLVLVVSVWLAYRLRTRVPLLPRAQPSVEASHSNPKSPQDPTPPPKN